MEIAKIEMAALESVIESQADCVVELEQSVLCIVGGGCGEVIVQ